MARKTSADIRAEIADLTASAQAIIDLAKEADNRELDAEEETHFNEIHAKLATAKAELDKVEAFEAKRREIAEMQMQQAQPLAPVGGVSVKSATQRLQAQHRLGPLRAFKGPDAARDAYDSGMWLRCLFARGQNMRDEEAEARIATRNWQIGTVQNIATEGSPTGGGFLVPTPLSNAIIDVRALAGISRLLARVVPMTSETQKIAKKTAGTTVYYPGETGSITASDQSWAQVMLTAKDRAILSKISQQLRDDAIISVVDDLASQMGTDFAVKEDAEFIKGDGTSTYGGVTGMLAALGSAGTSTPANGAGLSVWSGQTITQMVNTMSLLPDKYWQYGPVWVCSSVFYFQVMLRVQAAAGGNTIASLEDGARGQARPMFLGYPVYFTNQMPTATAVSTVSALFGSFNQAALIGDRGGISIAQSEHLGFAENVLAVRAITRYDINCHDVGDASTAGAVVGFKTAAS